MRPANDQRGYLFFQAVSEVAKRGGIVKYCPIHNQFDHHATEVNSNEAFLVMLEGCRKLFLTDEAIKRFVDFRVNRGSIGRAFGDGSLREIDNNWRPEPLCLPFEICWFEAVAPLVCMALGREGISDITDHQVVGALVSNCSEGILGFLLVAQGVQLNLKVFEVAILYESTENPDPFSKMLYELLRDLMEFMKNDCAMSKRSIDFKQRIGTGAERRLIRVRNIVDVVLKSERKAYEKSAGRKVEWSHRWEVMGHWRKIQGIGKDQFGNYKINGFTWVSDYEKGPEKLELMKKTRLVHGGQDAKERQREAQEEEAMLVREDHIRLNPGGEHVHL